MNQNSTENNQSEQQNNYVDNDESQDLSNQQISETDKNVESIEQEQITAENVYKLYLQFCPDSVNARDILFLFPDKFTEKYSVIFPPKALANAFSEMVLTKNQFFDDIMKSPGSLDVFVDHFIPLINPNICQNKNDNKMRIELVRSISLLLTNYTDEISLFQESLKTFLQILLLIVEYGDVHSAIESFRSFTQLYSNYRHFLSPRFQKLFLFRLVANSPITSPLHYLSMNYVVKNYPEGFHFIPLCSVLIMRELFKADNLISIELFLKLAGKEEPFNIYNSLFETVILHSYLSRSAVGVIVHTLPSFKNNADAIHYLLFLFRKVLIFMGFAKSLSRYKYRIYLIENLYKAILSPELGQIAIQVRKIMKSLIKNNYCLDLNDDSYDNIEPDQLSDSFLSSSISIPQEAIKKFAVYPYDTNIDSLLIEDDLDDYSSDS